MQIDEFFPALAPVVSAFDKIGILYYIGVLKVQENNLDMEYLKNWIDRLHLSDLWERLLAEKE